MNKMLDLMDEFVLKAIILTEEIQKNNLFDDINFEEFTDNRDRLFLIIDQISKTVHWDEVDEEKKNDLNKKIEYIKKLDNNLILKLQEYQTKLKQEIENTVRQKDNIRAYNLNDVK